MLKTKVVLLDVTNLSDARYAAGMGVDFIGFSINPVSNQYVTAEDVNTITEWLSGVSLIGNIGSSIPDYEVYKIDYLLTSNADLVPELDDPGLTLNLSSQNLSEVKMLLKEYQDKTAFYVLKIEPDELASLYDELGHLNKAHDCYISTEFIEENLTKVLHTKPKGIVLYGSHEEKPGLSNYDGIADVLEMLDEV